MQMASWFQSKRSATFAFKALRTSAMQLIALSAVSSLFTPTANAKTFTNAYVSFELPDKWDCTLEQTEYVCRTSAPGVDNREAVIILTAKEVGPADQLPLYMQHLKQARTINSRSGQTLQSQVYKVEQTTINNQPWIDGMHISSEVPNYYTRYLATTKDKIAILVTFSAHKLFYTKYNSDFFRAIKSLKVVADASSMRGRGGSGPGGGEGGPLGSSMGGTDDFNNGELPSEGSDGRGGKNDAQTMLGLAFVVLAVGAYFLLKKDKSKKKKKRRPPPP